MKNQLIKPKPRLLVIVGPTASGKSTLALRLARWLGSAQAREKFDVGGAEIVSADSRQIYRGMDVGTAKPRLIAKGKWLMAEGIPHHLIDIKNPNEDYTVAEYKRDAIRAIHKIIARGKLPIMVGGTGLYVKAVVHNLKIPKVKADLVLRRELEAEQKEKGAGFLMGELVSIDPDAAYVVDPKNTRRVIRALEIALGEKKLFSGSRKLGKPLFQTLQIGVGGEKNKLRAQIEHRSREMIQDGLIQEVEKLVKKFCPSTHSTTAQGGEQSRTTELRANALPRAFDAIGYREAIDYLNHKITKEKLIELLTKNTWQYARRQMTWFKKDPKIYWVKSEKETARLVTRFLKN